MFLLLHVLLVKVFLINHPEVSEVLSVGYTGDPAGSLCSHCFTSSAQCTLARLMEQRKQWSTL